MGLRAAVRLGGKPAHSRRSDRQIHANTENSLIPLLSLTKQSKIRDRKEQCAKVSWIDRQRKFFESLSVSLLTGLVELAAKACLYDCYIELPYGVLFCSDTLLEHKCRMS